MDIKQKTGHHSAAYRKVDLNIWDCICASFRLGQPFTLEEAGRAATRLVRDGPGKGKFVRAYSGPKGLVERRVKEALERLQSPDIKQVDDTTYVLLEAVDEDVE